MNYSELNFACISCVFARCFGSLVLLPLGSGFSSYSRQFIIAVLETVFIIWGVRVDANLDFINIISEFVIGVLISLPTVLVLEGAISFGSLIDTGRGQNQASLYEPVRNLQLNIMGLLYSNYCFVIALSSGLLLQLIVVVEKSIHVLPLNKVELYSLFRQSNEILNFIGLYLAGTLSCFIVFASLYLVIDIAMSFIAKAAHSIGLESEIFQLKTYSSFFLLIVLLEFDVQFVMTEIMRPDLYLLTLNPG
jgi:type III secretory pathway component EscT